MSQPNFSRRRLLSAFLAAPLAWLCPRPRRAAAAPHRRAQPAAWRLCKYDSVRNYTYDASGHIIRKEERLVRRAAPHPCPPITLNEATLYSYDRVAP